MMTKEQTLTLLSNVAQQGEVRVVFENLTSMRHFACEVGEEFTDDQRKKINLRGDLNRRTVSFSFCGRRCVIRLTPFTDQRGLYGLRDNVYAYDIPVSDLWDFGILRAKPFETLLRSNNQTDIYLCNPYKNILCSKRGCALGPDGLYQQCFYTDNPDYALQDKHGAPIKYSAKIGDVNAEVIGLAVAAQAIAGERVLKLQENLGYSDCMHDGVKYSARKVLEEAEGFNGLMTKLSTAIIQRVKARDENETD